MRSAQRQKRSTVSKNFPTSQFAPQKNMVIGSNNNDSNAATTQDNQHNTKISISDAIGLITIRLSKLETRTSGHGNNTSGSESNMQLVNKDTVINIVNRIDAIESNYDKIANSNYQEDLDEVHSNMEIFEDKLNQLFLKLNELNPLIDPSTASLNTNISDNELLTAPLTETHLTEDETNCDDVNIILTENNNVISLQEEAITRNLVDESNVLNNVM
tara:strand:- start:1066 stop:1713 length:648 start_codon:yes stop_codon:yes gene_type:complete